MVTIESPKASAAWEGSHSGLSLRRGRPIGSAVAPAGPVPPDAGHVGDAVGEFTELSLHREDPDQHQTWIAQMSRVRDGGEADLTS